MRNWWRRGACSSVRFGIRWMSPWTPSRRFDLVVVRLEFVVGQRPVGDVRARHRTVQRAALEVVAPEPRDLRVPVDRAAADRRRQVVDVADERVRDPAPRLRLCAARSRLEDRVLVLEEALLLDLVVAEQRPDRPARPEPRKQVATLLEDQHRVALLSSAHAVTLPPAPEPTMITEALLIGSAAGERATTRRAGRDGPRERGARGERRGPHRRRGLLHRSTCGRARTPRLGV